MLENLTLVLIIQTNLPPQGLDSEYAKQVDWVTESNLALTILAYTTGTTSKHQRAMWPELYWKLIVFLHIVVWHMKVSARLFEVTV